jgi:hypothetical protein
MFNKKKICKTCNELTYIWARGECRYCSFKKSPIKKKVVVRKESGELEVFKMIWNERPHHCEVCKTTLHIFDHWNFAHILGKGAYQRFRLLKENILLACRNCHSQYDNGSTENDPKFKWVLEKKQKLKMKYYGIEDE